MKLYDDYVLEQLKEHGFNDFKELHTYISDCIFHRSEKYYLIQEKYYRMSAIDAYRYEVRLQEINQYGELILDDNRKVYSRKMDIDKFEDIAEVFDLAEKGPY